MQQSPPDIDILRRDARAGHPGACYNLGVWLLTGEGGQPDPEGARAQFEKGAASQHAPSESALGYLLLRGHGGPPDATAAYGLFDRAARRGYQEAIFRRGELRAAGVGTPLDLESARLDFAAAVDHPQAQLHLAYCLEQGLGGARDPAAATALVVVAARSGDPAGLLALGRRLEHGHTLPANVCAARWCYEEAARRGCPLADERTADLDCRMPPAPPDLNKLTAPSNDLDRPRSGPGVVVLSWQPRVFFFRGFMDLEERSHLIRMAAPLLQPSGVIQRGSGANVRSAGRRGGVARLIAPLKDVVIANVERRIAEATRVPVENGEPIAVLHYGPGDEYRRHHDYFDPAIPGRERPLARGGQRIATFMAYLCAVEAGGATRFPDADLRVRAEPGSAILFYNTLPDGSLDPSSLHAGEPVSQGEKWVATRWLRERRYTGPI